MLACSESGTETIDRSPVAVQFTSERRDSAAVGTRIRLSARVVDEQGSPVTGVQVRFSIAGSQHVDSVVAATDASGEATTSMTLSDSPGANILTAAVSGVARTASAKIEGYSQLLFQSNRAGDYELYVVNGDGTDLRNVTRHPARDRNGAWSPDGRRIAFESNRDGNSEIYIMDADGGGLVRVTDHPAADQMPSWSPAGDRLAFASSRDGNYEIYTVRIDGTDSRRLTHHPAGDFFPAWSPDGTRISFDSERTGNSEIFVMETDGSEARNLTNHPAHDVDSDWSPTGERVAFARWRNEVGTEGSQIYLIRPDATAPAAVPGTDFAFYSALAPSWAPSGKSIAFAVEYGSAGSIGRRDLYSTDLASGKTTILQRGSVNDRPRWRP